MYTVESRFNARPTGSLRREMVAMLNAYGPCPKANVYRPFTDASTYWLAYEAARTECDCHPNYTVADIRRIEDAARFRLRERAKTAPILFATKPAPMSGLFL